MILFKGHGTFEFRWGKAELMGSYLIKVLKGHINKDDFMNVLSFCPLVTFFCKDDTFLVQEIFQLVRPPVFYPQSRYYLFLNPNILCALIIFIKKSLMTNFLIEKRLVTSSITQN